MNKRKQAHRDTDDQVQQLIRTLDKSKYNTDHDFIMAVNMLDKVYRPFLHVITDAEFDDMEPAAVTVAMVELAVSMTGQMASRVVPDGDFKFAREWFGVVINQLINGVGTTCRVMFPETPYINPGETMQ